MSPKDRMTHKRENGIKSGYWSPNKKEELVKRLAEYEDIGYCPDDIRLPLQIYDHLVEERGWRYTEHESPIKSGEYIVAINGATESTTLFWDKETEVWSERPCSKGEIYKVDAWIPMIPVPGK